MALNVLQRISELSRYFSKSDRKLANAVIYEYEKIAYMTAAQLGAYCNVSESTVIRFAKNLEYKGYKEFQQAVITLLRSKMTPNQRIQVTKNKIGRGYVPEMVMESDIDKIRHSLEKLDKDRFYEAVDTINTCRTLYIMGARSAEPIARLFHYNMSLIFDNVKLVTPASSNEVFEQMFSINEEDAVFALTFPRYSNKIINAVKFANSKGAKTIVLTDSKTAPIANYASTLITAQSDMASFMDSLVAPLSIINAIVVEITRRNEKEITKRFDTLEKLWDEYDVYTDK